MQVMVERGKGHIQATTVLQVMIERENELASQMRLQEATNDRKNALEAYVYGLRGKLGGPLEQYVTPADRDSILAQLEKTEVGPFQLPSSCPILTKLRWVSASCHLPDPLFAPGTPHMHMHG